MTRPRTAEMNDLLERLGKRMREVRESRGMSLRGIATLLGTEGSNYQLLERGRKDFRMTTLFAIARVLRVRPADLIDVAPLEHDEESYQ